MQEWQAENTGIGMTVAAADINGVTIAVEDHHAGGSTDDDMIAQQLLRRGAEIGSEA